MTCRDVRWSARADVDLDAGQDLVGDRDDVVADHRSDLAQQLAAALAELGLEVLVGDAAELLELHERRVLERRVHVAVVGPGQRLLGRHQDVELDGRREVALELVLLHVDQHTIDLADDLGHAHLPTGLVFDAAAGLADGQRSDEALGVGHTGHLARRRMAAIQDIAAGDDRGGEQERTEMVRNLTVHDTLSSLLLSKRGLPQVHPLAIALVA